MGSEVLGGKEEGVWKGKGVGDLWEDEEGG